jgi:hypothetical protein
VRLEDNRMDFWYGDDSLEQPMWSWIDTEYRHSKASRPVIVCHAGFGSILTYFDDVRQEVPNENGTVWIQNTVPANTPVFSTQRTLLAVEYGGEE